MHSVPYPRFQATEYDRRWKAIGELSTSAGLDALIVYGTGAARHELTWLTGWGPRQEGYLVSGGGEPPALFVQLYNHVPTAQLMSIIERVEWGGTDSASSVAADLLARGRPRRVGIVGAVPYQQHRRLAAALDGAELIDVTQAFRRLRLVKSSDEIEWTRQGAALCDAAMRVLVAEARPGITEHELGSLVEAAYGRLGGSHGICFLATAPMHGGGRFVPSQHWSSRRIERGDLIMIELSAGIGGYTGQILRTIAIGDAPPPEVRRLHDVAEAAFEAIADTLRPDAAAADLLAAAGVIDQAGLTVCDDVVHGYGGGYLPPVLRTPMTMHGPTPDLVFQPGMMVVVQPNVITHDRSLGVQTGELLLVADGGAESMHTFERGLLRAGG